MELHVIIDNLPSGKMPQLHSELGLCLQFSIDGQNFLVDSGASGKALENMDMLHSNGTAVPQPEDIDAVFISHGHNDHTGGLRKFIERNPAAPIYLHNSVRGNYFFSCRPKNGIREARSIGMEQALFAEYEERFREIEGATRITEKIALIPITGSKGFATPMGNEFLFKNDFPDNFSHEVAILVEHTPGEYTVISPCTHNGILNVLECCTRYLSTPSCAENEEWCKNGHFSAPNDAQNEKWCQNRHISTPNDAQNEKWCQNGHFSAPSYGKNRAADGATVGATGETAGGATVGTTGEAGGGAAGEVLSGRGKIKYFVGGLHYVDYLQGCGENKEAAQIIGTAHKLKELYPALKVFSGHCTCSAAGELLGSVLGDNYATFCTGSTIMCK